MSISSYFAIKFTHDTWQYLSVIQKILICPLFLFYIIVELGIFTDFDISNIIQLNNNKANERYIARN